MTEERERLERCLAETEQEQQKLADERTALERCLVAVQQEKLELAYDNEQVKGQLEMSKSLNVQLESAINARAVAKGVSEVSEDDPDPPFSQSTRDLAPFPSTVPPPAPLRSSTPHPQNVRSVAKTTLSKCQLQHYWRELQGEEDEGMLSRAHKPSI